MNRFEILFTPIRIGTMKVKNRIVMPSMATNYATPDGIITQRMIDHFEARAKGGVGLIISEVTSIDPLGKYIANTLGIWDDKQILGWRELAEVVHAYGAKLVPQLMHPSMESPSALSGVQPIACSPIASRVVKEVPRELNIKEIGELIDKFAEGARRAREAGCDGIELHAAHAYLLVGTFMSPLYNKRTDAYGGSIDGRLKLPLEIIRRIKTNVGHDFPLILRIAGHELIPGGRTIQETQYIAPILVDAGVDALHISGGTAPTMPQVTDAPHGTPLAFNVPYAAAVKEVVNVPVIAVGRINNPLIAEHILKTGKADLVAMGRALLADPELPNKAFAGNFDEIVPCIACNYGCHGNLSSGKPITCLVNPALGKEREMTITLAKKPKKVLVAGGGPGGLEAALVSALRGHQVTLFEKSNKLGGQLNIASVAPLKQELSLIIKYLSIQIEKAGIKVELSREVTPNLVQKLNPDIVIVATGATPLIPNIPGVKNEKVITAYDVLAGKVVVGNNVIIIGGGMVGCEVADFVADNRDNPIINRTVVTIVEMLEDIALDMAPASRLLLMPRLREKGVEVITYAKVKEILDDGVVYVKNGQERSIRGMDNIVLALGTKSVDEISNKIRDIVSEVYVVGDAKEPRKALEAIAEGAEIARKI